MPTADVRACRKRDFGSRADAELAVAWARLAFVLGAENRLEDRAYYCTFCRAWHITSQPRRTGC